jgi:hypothetical protein
VGVLDGNQFFLVALWVGQRMVTKTVDLHLTHPNNLMAIEISIAIKGGDQNLLIAIPCHTLKVTKKI